MAVKFVVPESMAYAAIAGVPVQYGLYSAPLALLGYVVFGNCRQLFAGPSATVASISAVAVGGVASGSVLFAKPVLDGFIVGLGLYIAVGQVPKLAGVAKPSGNTVQIFFRTLREIGSCSWQTFAVRAAARDAVAALGRSLAGTTAGTR